MNWHFTERKLTEDQNQTSLPAYSATHMKAFLSPMPPQAPWSQRPLQPTFTVQPHRSPRNRTLACFIGETVALHFILKCENAGRNKNHWHGWVWNRHKMGRSMLNSSRSVLLRMSQIRYKNLFAFSAILQKNQGPSTNLSILRTYDCAHPICPTWHLLADAKPVYEISAAPSPVASRRFFGSRWF